MPPALALSGVVITKNEGDRIARCVRSLAEVCAEVIVLDSGSTDDTVAQARAAGARVEHQDWLGFSEQKNAVIALASHPWVLLLDADEWLAPGAAEAIRGVFAHGQVESAEIWRLQRRTHYLGKALNFGGWGNESVERIFRQPIRYWPAKVHEKLDNEGLRIRSLRARIEHDTARSDEQYTAKLVRYAQLFAEQRFEAGRAAGPLAPFGHWLFYLMKNFVVRGGFLDGPNGWLYHRRHARYVYDKYQFLRAMTAARTAAKAG